MDISEKVLKEIESKDLKPKAKWLFTLQNLGLWFMGSVFLVVAGLALAVVLYVLRSSDWDVYHYISNSLFGFVFTILPYFWLVFLAAALLVFDYIIKRTKSGYKHSLLSLSLISLAVSVVLGMAFYRVGMGYRVNSAFSERVPAYNKFVYHKVKLWQMPDQGRLAGFVVTDPEGNVFFLRDINRDRWQVTIAEQNYSFVRVGNRLRLVGEVVGTYQFRADQVMPWLPGRRPKLDKARMIKVERKFNHLRNRMYEDLKVNRLVTSINCTNYYEKANLSSGDHRLGNDASGRWHQRSLCLQ